MRTRIVARAQNGDMYVAEVAVAACRGGLMVTRSLPSDDARWRITHAQSSRLIGWRELCLTNKREAMVAFRALLDSGVDWTVHETQLSRPHMAKRVTAAIVAARDAINDLYNK